MTTNQTTNLTLNIATLAGLLRDFDDTTANWKRKEVRTAIESLTELHNSIEDDKPLSEIEQIKSEIDPDWDLPEGWEIVTDNAVHLSIVNREHPGLPGPRVAITRTSSYQPRIKIENHRARKVNKANCEWAAELLCEIAHKRHTAHIVNRPL